MMTVTVWYNGEVDEVFEDVQSVSSLKNSAVQVSFMEGGIRQNKVVYLDEETSVMIGTE